MRTAGVVRPKLVINGDPFGAELKNRLARLVDATNAALPAAANKATAVSRSTFDDQRSGRPFVPGRPGRPTTQGTFSSFIHWRPATEAGDGVVKLDVFALDSAHDGRGVWLIQEIGTGKSAYIGEPADSNERRVKVKSQIGRAIPFGLVWANAGNYRGPDRRARTDQLLPIALTKGASTHMSAGVIRREIQGKHYLRDGGAAGYDQFAATAIDAAVQAFKGREWAA